MCASIPSTTNLKSVIFLREVFERIVVFVMALYTPLEEHSVRCPDVDTISALFRNQNSTSQGARVDHHLRHPQMTR